MPADKVVEARHQTTHKLELMEHYWGAWCNILARTVGRHQFCPTRLWLIDTHAGPGRHLSESDPDGQVPGTPMLAAIAARDSQRRFPGVEVRVRATDKNKRIADELTHRLSGLKGKPPDRVDVTVAAVDWVQAVPHVRAEIAREDHPHGGRQGASDHEHRSLWFIDPFGVEGIDHAVIESFPAGSEVIVNLDLMALLRLVGKADKGDRAAAELLDAVFGGSTWRGAGSGSRARKPLADAFATSFPTKRWRYGSAHLLRPTGSQDRAMIHLTNADTADKAFTRAVRSALARDTVTAGRKLSKPAKDRGAQRLFERFGGLRLTTREMRSMVSTWDLGQMRAICNAADHRGLGHWDEATSTMEWFEERVPELTLGL
jgi:three-Cys-motif partner protein